MRGFMGLVSFYLTLKISTYNATKQTFFAKDLIIYGFRKILHEVLLLQGVVDSKPVENKVKKGVVLRAAWTLSVYYDMNIFGK